MKKWFPLLVVLLLLLISGCQPVRPARAQASPETASLHREVQLLNLINGLELMPEQMCFVLEKAQEAQETREELKGEADAEEMSAVLEEMRGTLMEGQNLSPELRERFFAAKADNERLMEEYQEEVTRLAQEIEGVLEEHQLYALERYVPCVIPPEGELRVGQAQGTGGGEAVLERLRALPADRFDRHEEEIARRVLERIREHLHGAVLILDEEAELERMESLIEETRALSDVEFELQKGDLVEELLAPYEVARPQRDTTMMIARHLLDPAIIPLLEEKLSLVD